MNRQESLEVNYRRAVSDKLYELLIILAPDEQMEIGALSYAQLVTYAERKIAEERKALSSDSDDGLVI